MLIKPRFGSSFKRLGLVPAAPSFRAAHSEQTTPLRNPIMRPHSRKRSTPYLKSMYGKRVQATFTPVLLHFIISTASSQLKQKHLFVVFYQIKSCCLNYQSATYSTNLAT